MSNLKFDDILVRMRRIQISLQFSGANFVKVGISPGMGGSFTLPQKLQNQVILMFISIPLDSEFKKILSKLSYMS